MIYLSIRKTLDWKNAELVAARLRPAFRAKVSMWDATFRMPYHEFRHELKEIAQRNLANVAGATIAPVDEVPLGALLVPVDDDDWFAPDLVQRLEAVIEPNVTGYYWIRNILEVPGARSPLKRWFRSRRPLELGPTANQGRYTCGTNNYAFVTSTESSELVASHEVASRVFDAYPDHVKHLPATLSLQNRNISSQTALAFRRPDITRGELLRTYRSYLRLYPRVRLAAGLAWAAPYIDAVAELTAGLMPRR